MIDERFVLLAALLNAAGAASYLIGTIRGTVKPNRVTWFIWAVAPLMAFAAEVQQGVGWPALMTFMVGFSPLLILLASFVNEHSVWRLGRLDIVCGALSLLGLTLWLLTRNGDVAIVLSVITDALAATPTIVKSYSAPSTEDDRLYLFSAISAGITILTLVHWNVAHVAFPVYILSMSTLLFVMIRFNKRIPRLLKR